MKPNGQLVRGGSFGKKKLNGLNNMGNTCFLNVVLQILTNTKPLKDDFLTKQHSSACEFC
jgi:ubiquitin C-terminal hydrolase